jgi:hypothetical protein
MFEQSTQLFKQIHNQFLFKQSKFNKVDLCPEIFKLTEKAFLHEFDELWSPDITVKSTTLDRSVLNRYLANIYVKSTAEIQTCFLK